MFDIGIPELLIVLVIVVLIFGPGRLAKTMGELGSSLRSFREAFKPDESAETDNLAQEVVHTQTHD